MKTKMSPAQIKSYRKNGFLVVENFLTPAELKKWRKTTDDAVADRLKSRGPLTNQGDEESYYSLVFTQAIRLADSWPAMTKLIYNKDMGKVVASLAGVKGLRVWHDQALIKPPYGNPTGWHLDCPYWSFDSRDAISIWVALDDATLENGCMWYVPGTHKTATFDNSGIGQNLGALFKIYPQWKKISPVACPCPAGTAVFHNGLVAHGAGANMTNKQRRAMTCGFMPEGSRFNGKKNILPTETFERLKIGDVLDDSKQNPVVWP